MTSVQLTSEAEKRGILARARCMSAGIRLVLAEIDEIGIALTNDWIDPGRAANDLAAIEQLPVYFASLTLRPDPIMLRLEADDANRPKPIREIKQYRTPQATIDAFWYVVGLNDQPRLLQWLNDHPKDASYLEKLLEAKCLAKS